MPAQVFRVGKWEGEQTAYLHLMKSNTGVDLPTHSAGGASTLLGQDFSAKWTSPAFQILAGRALTANQ